MIYKLVLVSDIHKYEAKGWNLSNNNIHLTLGGCGSVWMKKKRNN